MDIFYLLDKVDFQILLLVTLKANCVNLWHTTVLDVLGHAEFKSIVCQALQPTIKAQFPSNVAAIFNFLFCGMLVHFRAWHTADLNSALINTYKKHVCHKLTRFASTYLTRHISQNST